jgi:hypothetical protein
MLQIRHGVFETNSSSTHSITMCMKSEFESWENGEVYLNDGWWGSDCSVNAKDKNFITKDEAVELMCNKHSDNDKDSLSNLGKEEFEDVLYEYEIYSWNTFWNRACDWYEDYTNEFTTENGDEVVAFGYYGYN